jgi:MSHA biogenesis protein MshK
MDAIVSSTVRFGVCILAAALGARAAPAQPLPDPTQPPASIARPATAAEAPAALQLQAVIRGPGEQRTAVISGQRMRVGDSVTTASGPARVAAIFDDRVLLIRGNTRETLSLLPSVATRPSSSPGK